MKMGLKQILVYGIIIFGCITILEISYAGFVIGKNFKEFSWLNLIATVLLNLSIIFFAVFAILGAISHNFGLLITCLAYSVVEFVRSSINVYDTWNDGDEKTFNRFFVTFDAGTLKIFSYFFIN